MRQITISQYESALKILIDRHRAALQELYYQPNSSATAQQFAEIVHPSNPSIITANGIIGKMGKAIAEHLGITPDNYDDGRNLRPAYFRVISDIYDITVGWTLNPNLKKALENLQLVSSEREVAERFSTETLPFTETDLYREGRVVKVFVNRYERNPEARRECIKHHGDNCAACSFDFATTYGKDIATGYIHVHHIIEISSIGKEYVVDPINDLIPLCANCHAAIHMTNPAMSVDELIERMKKAKK